MPDYQGTRAVVLLVEDDPGDQELTRRALHNDIIRTDLRIVSDGEEAMEYLHQEDRYLDSGGAPRPDLVLLDLNMPLLDGRGVLKRMRASETLKSIPVVILTTSKQEEDIVRSYKLGCNSFITKPVEMSAFVEVVKELGSYWFELVTLPGGQLHGAATTARAGR
jgi:CheY-like chemotaxis protein